MKITPLANLHGFLPEDYELPPSDVLAIAGGLLPYCRDNSMIDNLIYQSIFISSHLNPWLSHQANRFGMVIMTWGYTDILPYLDCLKTTPKYLKLNYEALPNNIAVSIDSTVTYKGKNFFAIPWNNETNHYAFSMNNLDEEYVWNNIPSDTDILISHESPMGVFSKSLGSNALHSRVVGHPRIRSHIFGHLHAPGKMITDKTYVNASYTYVDNKGFFRKDPYSVNVIEI